MRAARVLMNLGRASALAAGPRRRGADREAWNRSRRTLLRAREAAERTGGTLGEEAVKLEEQMAARERTERERGIPVGYEPGKTPPAERPASYFVRDPEARAQLEAKERAEGGPDLDRAERAHHAYRKQIATVSRGYGAPAAPKPRTDLRPGAAYAIQETRRPGAPMVQEVPAERMEGAPPAEDRGTVRLGEGYPAPSMEREQALGRARAAHVQAGSRGAEAYEQSIAAGATEQEAQDAVVAVQRQQAFRAQLQAAGAPILAGPQALGEIQAQQAAVAAQQAEEEQARAMAEAGEAVAPQMAQAEVGGAEAQVRMQTAQAAYAEVEAAGLATVDPETLGKILTGRGPLTAEEAMRLRMELVTSLVTYASQLPEGSPERVEIEAMTSAMLTGQPVPVPRRDTIARIWTFLRYASGLGLVTPEMTRDVQPPAWAGGGAGAAPAAGGAAAAGAQAGAVIPGNVDTATATPEELVAIRDAAEAELQRRRQIGAL